MEEINGSCVSNVYVFRCKKNAKPRRSSGSGASLQDHYVKAYTRRREMQRSKHNITRQMQFIELLASAYQKNYPLIEDPLIQNAFRDLYCLAKYHDMSNTLWCLYVGSELTTKVT